MKLKTIIENLNKMPSTLKGFSETPKLTAEQKNKLMEMVKNYNQLGQKLRMENSLIETATALSEISELAETYACNEASDWFATEVVKSDFKRAKGISETFQKLARECHGKVQQLNALYEDMGKVLERYYEIDDPIAEVSPNPMDIKGQRGLPNAQPQTVMQEVKPNDKNIKSQRQLPANGPIAEVSHNDKNIKSQRNLPAGGPAPAQVKEVAVDDKHANIKGQRNLPAGGPATPQVKETTQNHPPMQTCKKCGKPITQGLSIELCPVCAQSKPINMKEVHPNDKNVKGQRNLPAGGPTSYNPPKDPKDTGSVKESTEEPTSGTGTCGWENGKAWRYDHKTGKRVWDTGIQKSERDKQSGMSSYERNQLAKHGMTSIDEVKPNDSNLQSQRELPQGGPESYSYDEIENPSIPVNPAGSGEMNVKGERDVPQGGPSKDVAYESFRLGDILKTIK